MTATRSLFFYGTLRHAPLLETVLGPGAGRVRLRPARLQGHAVHWADGESFPIIVEGDGVAEGLLAEGLLPEDVARLDFYENGYHYDLVPVEVETDGGAVTAEVYKAAVGAWAVGAPWSLEDWVARWGAMSVFAAQEYMDGFGRFGAREMAERFGTMRMRAEARVRGASETRARAVGRGEGPVEVVSRRRPFTGYFTVDVSRLRYPRFDGTQSAAVTREAFVSADAVTVLPYDPVRDRVMVIEQFRFAPFARGDSQPWTMEPIAGRIDPGETAEATARREAEEEAGIVLRELFHVADYYPSPGALTEYLYTYVGFADLPDGAGGTFGLEDEAEDILSHILSFDEFMALVASGEADTGPLILTAYWLQANRERLRALA